MSKQIINIGNSPNDGNGEPARSAFNKINSNFTEIYNLTGDSPSPNSLATNLACLGAGQTMVGMKQARSLGTSYLNSTGRIILIFVRLEAINSGLQTIRLGFYIDGKMVWQSNAADTKGTGFMVAIENGKSYGLTLVSGSLPSDFSIEEWVELR